MPGWSRGEPVPSALYRYLDAAGSTPTLALNGQPVPIALRDGYAVLTRTWAPGDTITLDLPMAPRRVLADDRVEDDRGRVALERGPLVYCAEGADNGGSVLQLALADDAAIQPKTRADLFSGITVLETTRPHPGRKVEAARRHPVLRVVAPRLGRDGGLAPQGARRAADRTDSTATAAGSAVGSGRDAGRTSSTA